MLVFRTVDQFDRNTGKKVGTTRVYDHTICDYSGEVLDGSSNPNSYIIDFNDNDPCFGDGEGERWLYDYENKLAGGDANGYHHYELFGQSHYMFQILEDGYSEVFSMLLEEARNEKLEVYSLDHLLRWSRGRMLERIIKQGKYKIADFCESEERDYETI